MIVFDYASLNFSICVCFSVYACRSLWVSDCCFADLRNLTYDFWHAGSDLSLMLFYSGSRRDEHGRITELSVCMLTENPSLAWTRSWIKSLLIISLLPDKNRNPDFQWLAVLSIRNSDTSRGCPWNTSIFHLGRAGVIWPTSTFTNIFAIPGSGFLHWMCIRKSLSSQVLTLKRWGTNHNTAIVKFGTVDKLLLYHATTALKSQTPSAVWSNPSCH